MDEGHSYELVDRKGDLTGYLAVAMPILFAGLIWARGSSPTAARPHPWTDPTFMAVVIGCVIAFEASVLWHRARARATRLIVAEDALVLQRGDRQLWRVSWADLALVSLRKYTLRYSYFHEALVIEPRNGKVRIVPTASACYGRVPGLDDLLHRVESKGTVIQHDRRPTWITE